MEEARPGDDAPDQATPESRQEGSEAPDETVATETVSASTPTVALEKAEEEPVEATTESETQAVSLEKPAEEPDDVGDSEIAPVTEQAPTPDVNPTAALTPTMLEVLPPQAPPTTPQIPTYWQQLPPGYPPPVYPPPAARRTGRRLPLILFAVAACIALVACLIGVVTWWRMRDDAPQARPTEMLPGTYPTEPEFAWTARASTFVDGPESAISTPIFGAVNYRSPDVLVVGDQLLFHAASERFAEKAELVSVDIASGRTKWQVPVDARHGCAKKPLKNTLPCFSGKSVIDYVDLGRGTTTSSVRVPDWTYILASDGDKLLTAGYSKDMGFTVAKGPADDPGRDWTTPIDDKNCEPTGSGDAYDVEDDSGVILGYNGSAEAVLRASDGRPLIDHPVVNAYLADGPAIVATRCLTIADGLENWPDEVFDTDGTLRFTAPDRVIKPRIDVHTGGPNPFVTRKGDGLDPKTGDVKWRIPGWEDASPSTWVVGNIMVGRTSDTMTGYDLTSGKTLWSTPVDSLGAEAVTDGPNIIVAVKGGVTAYRLSDGERLWTTDTGSKYEPRLRATDAGLVVVSEDKVGLLTPTGPPAAVPSSKGTKNTDKDRGETKLVTKCGRPAKLQPVETHTESDGLVITMKVVAQCPGGDVISGSQTRVSVSSSGQNIASGTFDLSAKPIVVPPDSSGSNASPSVEHKFRFPLGTFWRLPVSIREKPGPGSTQTGPTDLDASTFVVDCQESGSIADSAEYDPSAADPTTASTAEAPAPPATGDPESAAFDALRALANSDMPFVTAQLADRWVPQLSSKRPGLVAEGITWNNSETLREHLQLRLKYPEVRLLYSGDWSTFSSPDFWVTIAGVTFADSGAALRWCTTNGFDRDHCYAKLVSKTHPVAGSTALNK